VPAVLSFPTGSLFLQVVFLLGASNTFFSYR
jgi:hypothetical protein